MNGQGHSAIPRDKDLVALAIHREEYRHSITRHQTPTHTVLDKEVWRNENSGNPIEKVIVRLNPGDAVIFGIAIVASSSRL